MRPFADLFAPGEPDPSKEVAAENPAPPPERGERALARQPALLAPPQTLPLHTTKTGPTQVAPHRSPATPRPRPQATQRRDRAEGALVSSLMRIPLIVRAALLISLAAPGSLALTAQSQGMSMPVGKASVPANSSLKVTVNGQTNTLTLAELKALPPKTVTFHNVHTKADESYTGVPLTDLLAKYGAPTGDKLRGKALSQYIVATGSDGYKAVLSLAETDPTFHPGDVIIADTIDGKPIDDKDGPFRLVVTEETNAPPARSTTWFQLN